MIVQIRAQIPRACVRESYNYMMCVGVRSYGLDCEMLGVPIPAWGRSDQRVACGSKENGYTEMMIWDAYLYCGSINLKK